MGTAAASARTIRAFSFPPPSRRPAEGRQNWVAVLFLRQFVVSPLHSILSPRTDGSWTAPADATFPRAHPSPSLSPTKPLASLALTKAADRDRPLAASFGGRALARAWAAARFRCRRRLSRKQGNPLVPTGPPTLPAGPTRERHELRFLKRAFWPGSEEMGRAFSERVPHSSRELGAELMIRVFFLASFFAALVERDGRGRPGGPRRLPSCRGPDHNFVTSGEEVREEDRLAAFCVAKGRQEQQSIHVAAIAPLSPPSRANERSKPESGVREGASERARPIGPSAASASSFR